MDNFHRQGSSYDTRRNKGHFARFNSIISSLSSLPHPYTFSRDDITHCIAVAHETLIIPFDFIKFLELVERSAKDAIQLEEEAWLHEMVADEPNNWDHYVHLNPLRGRVERARKHFLR